MYIMDQHVQHTAGNLGYCFIWKLEKRTRHSNDDGISQSSTLGVRWSGTAVTVLYIQFLPYVPVYRRNRKTFSQIPKELFYKHNQMSAANNNGLLTDIKDLHNMRERGKEVS